jgi:hypothetical protein
LYTYGLSLAEPDTSHSVPSFCLQQGQSEQRDTVYSILSRGQCKRISEVKAQEKMSKIRKRRSVRRGQGKGL